jgi:hypothetical protein
MAAEALRHPLAVAGRAFEPFVFGIVRLAARADNFMSILAPAYNDVTLVHGAPRACH